MGGLPQGQYIFCVVGLRGKGPADLRGAEGARVVRWKDLGAVVQDAPLADFGALEGEDLARRIARHQRVNERAMAAGTCVPMRFGVVAESEDQVRGLLEKACLQFETALERVRGKAEFAVHVTWEEDRVVQDIAAGDEGVRRLREEALRAPAGDGRRARIALGEAVHAALTRRRETYLEEVGRALRPRSTHWAAGRLRESAMIANLAFLVEREKEPLFRAALGQVGERHEGRLRLEGFGPLPPYSFCDIHLSLGSFELIDRSRKRLGLAEEASLAEIKRAYRELAVRHHPDRNPGGRPSAEKFKEILAAYESLTTYCRGYRYSFRREAVEDSISCAPSGGRAEEEELCAEGQPRGAGA